MSIITTPPTARRLYARTEVRRLGDELDAANTPLQAAQKAGIMEIMLEESERLPQPTLVPGEDPELDRARVFKWREDYERRTGERLEKLLTPSQYERYREHQEWQREYRGLQSTMRERLQARQQ